MDCVNPLFSLLFERSNDAIIFLDADDMVLEWNQAAFSLFGADFVSRRAFASLLSKSDAQQHLFRLAKCFGPSDSRSSDVDLLDLEAKAKEKLFHLRYFPFSMFATLFPAAPNNTRAVVVMAPKTSFPQTSLALTNSSTSTPFNFPKESEAVPKESEVDWIRSFRSSSLSITVDP